MQTNSVLGFLGRTIAACSTAELAPERTEKSRGEATEVGMLEAARALGIDVDVTRREHARRKLYRFDSKLRLMATIDERVDGSLTVHAKGAPEEVLFRSSEIGGPDDHVYRAGQTHRSRGRTPNASSASWDSSRSSIHRARKSPRRLRPATRPGYASLSSRATTGLRRLRSRVAWASPPTERRSSPARNSIG